MSEYSLTSTLEWLNGNMHRNYPLLDSAVPVDITGEHSLPSSFITDIQLVVPYVEGLDSSRFFISSVVRNVDSWLITIGYATDVSDPTTTVGFDCAISAPIPSSLEYTGAEINAHTIEIAAITTEPSQLSPSYAYGIPAAYSAMRGLRGTVYIGSCADFASVGAMQFLPHATPLMPTCIYIESPRQEVSSVRVRDGFGTDAVFTDNVTLSAGTGVKVQVSGNTVAFVIDTDYMQERFNDIFSAEIGNAIKTINGMTPAADGSFMLTGMDCTLINPAEHGVVISNPCSKPCCDSGGEDSADVRATLEQLAADKTVLENYYTDLATKINSMQARLSSLIASRK